MAHLDSMIVRPCLGQDREPIVVGMLELPERRALEQRIAAQPGQFVAQHPVAPSLNPKWDGETLVPSAVVLRCFVVAEGDSWRVLPGGLAREPAGDTALRSLGRLNGTLKDVWVLAEDAADVQIPTSRAFIRSPSIAAVPTCRAGSPTISTGSAAISSDSTTTHACCAPRRRGWRRA
jgi:uncharacterized circularly permuted ATP-grasp superfamily protein